MLTKYEYEPTAGELTELADAIRRLAAGNAGIDAERLTIEVTEVDAYEFEGQRAYFRASAAEVKLDGREFGSERAERKIRWWVQQSMMGLKKEPDRSRLTIRETYGSPGNPTPERSPDPEPARPCSKCGTSGISVTGQIVWIAGQGACTVRLCTGCVAVCRAATESFLKQG